MGMSDDQSIDVNRLSFKTTAVVAIIAWVLSAAAAYVGFQLALSDLRYENKMSSERMATLKEEVAEHRKEIRLLRIDLDTARERITLLEAGVKRR